jgi:hypothetical protein
VHFDLVHLLLSELHAPSQDSRNCPGESRSTIPPPAGINPPPCECIKLAQVSNQALINPISSKASLGFMYRLKTKNVGYEPDIDLRDNIPSSSFFMYTNLKHI